MIRAAGPDDAPALARLRYDFRVELDSATEAESAFLERCRSLDGNPAHVGNSMEVLAGAWTTISRSVRHGFSSSRKSPIPWASPSSMDISAACS